MGHTRGEPNEAELTATHGLFYRPLSSYERLDSLKKEILKLASMCVHFSITMLRGLISARRRKSGSMPRVGVPLGSVG